MCNKRIKCGSNEKFLCHHNRPQDRNILHSGKISFFSSLFYLFKLLELQFTTLTIGTFKSIRSMCVEEWELVKITRFCPLEGKYLLFWGSCGGNVAILDGKQGRMGLAWECKLCWVNKWFKEVFCCFIVRLNGRIFKFTVKWESNAWGPVAKGFLYQIFKIWFWILTSVGKE